MKIENRTHWKTEHLRAFASRVAETELEVEGRKRAKLIFEYTRAGRGGSSGRAWYASQRAVVRVARNHPDKLDLAMVIAHEMAHLRGLRHESPAMSRSPRYHRVGTWKKVYAWADAMPLEVDPAKMDHRCESLQGLGARAGFTRCNRPARWKTPSGGYRCKKHTLGMDGLTIEHLMPVVRAKPAPPSATEKRAKIERRIAAWTRKRKLADTYLKKWTRRLRRLEATEQKAAKAHALV